MQEVHAIMIDYDFSTLNDKEFENISIELISIDQGKRFERFKAGKDGGIDGRFYYDDGTQDLIQCKHYLKTGFDGLITSLKKKNEKGINEIAKVEKLNPKKYIFATSLPLSANDKRIIKQLFTPYIQNDCDIYGQEDLNDLLKKNPHIEECHYKLWISSTTVLKRIFYNAIKGRSEYLLEDIKEKSKRYAITDNHHKALDKLKESHCIIIAGEPGIGKTTLAEHIALMYIEKGYEFCVVENSLNEAEDIFDSEKKQLFYFDDFLGSNYLEALQFHQDSHIVKFISRVKKEKNKRFILTSRTNIFNQSILLSDAFKCSKLEKDEFIIKVDTLSEVEKAKILYNHIWHSNLSEQYIDELYKEKRYRIIIKHKNFNPRLIEFITDFERFETIKETEYWEFIIDKLNNPSDVWAQTFDHQSNEYIRNIVILAVLNGNKIKENDLIQAYEAMNQRMEIHNFTYASNDFYSVIKSVVKYFLNRTKIIKDTIEYSLFNPSIADFIINRYKTNEQRLTTSFLSLQTLESLNVLGSLHLNETIAKHLFQNIIMKCYEELNINSLEEKRLDYAIHLFYFLELYIDWPYDKKKVINFYENMTQIIKPFTLHEEFLFVLEQLLLREELNIHSFGFLKKLIDNANNTLDNINKIISFIKDFNFYDDEIVESLNDLIHQYLVEELDGKVADISLDDVNFDYDNEGYVYISRNSIDSFIENCLDDLIEEIDEFEEINIDKFSIKDSINSYPNEEDLIEAYYQSYEYEDFERDEKSYIDNIDDLFER